MRKLFKKISVIALALTLSMSCFVGCGQPPIREADQKLEVFIANRGYGIAGVTAALNAFAEQDWVKAKYPNLEIPTPVAERAPNYGIMKIKAPSTNQFDLLFVIEDFAQFFGKNASGASTLVDLTEVYESEVPNEGGITLKEKLHPDFLQYVKHTPRGTDIVEYYDVPWCTGYTGIVYNPNIFERYVEHIPRTTNELLELLVKIKNGDTIEPKPAGVTDAEWNLQNCGNEEGYALAPCGGASYDAYMLETWWAQYDGHKAFHDFWDGYYEDGLGRYQSEKVYEQKGRLYSLRVLEEMLDYDKAYYDLSLSEYDFMVGQATFLRGEYAMTNCADWFDSEMKSTREEMTAEYNAGKAGAMLPEELYVLKAPIISDLVEKLRYRNSDGTFMTDEQLSFLVDCIDKEMAFDDAKAAFEVVYPKTADKPKTELKQSDYDRLLEARAIYDTGAMQHTFAIPSVSNSIDVAEDFIRFFATDVCQLAYMEATEGQNTPFMFDPNSTASLYGSNKTVADAYIEVYNKCSPMQKERLTNFYNTFNPVKVLQATIRKPLVKVGYKSLDTKGDVGKILRADEAQSADELFQAAIAANDANRFKFLLFEAGLSDSY